MISFQDLADRFAPWWLRGRVGGALLQSIGATLDGVMQTLVLGLRAGNPLTCEPDALASIGRDRGLRRYPTEPEESYRARLAQWRQLHKLRGSHLGEMLQLQPYFLPAGRPMIRTVHQDGGGASATWHTLNPDGTYEVHRATPSNWDWDGSPLGVPTPAITAQWSRFWVIVYVDGLGLPEAEKYDEGAKYDEGSIWDGLITSDQIADIVQIINDWKAAHSTLWGVILATDPASFDPAGSGAGYPNGLWGYYIDHATGDPVRLASAVYSYDMGQAQE